MSKWQRVGLAVFAALVLLYAGIVTAASVRVGRWDLRLVLTWCLGLVALILIVRAWRATRREHSNAASQSRMT